MMEAMQQDVLVRGSLLNGSVPPLRESGMRESGPGRSPVASGLEKRIRDALTTPGRPGMRKIAARFGVYPGTVQRISRPFVAPSVAAVIP